MKRTYVPAKPRNKKLIGGMMVSSGGTASLGTQHSHANKDVIDRLTELNIDVLSYLSLHQTGVEMVQAVDEFGEPIVDEFGEPVMIEKLVPVLDSFGNPVLDVNGDPVMGTVPAYAVKSSVSIISEKEITAYGAGEEGEGGGSYDMLQSWVDYTEEKSNWVVSAALSKGLLDRIVALEDGGGTGGSNVAWGALSSGYRELNVDGTTYSVATSTHSHTEYAEVTHSHAISDVWGLETALSGKAAASHHHSGVYEPVFNKNTAFNKSFGTTSGTVAQGNDSRIDNGQTAYSWGNHASAGYATSSALGDYVTLATAQTISGAKTFSANLTASVSVTTPNVIFAAAGWSLEQIGTELQMKYNGAAKMMFLNGGSIVATQEITAYS